MLKGNLSCNEVSKLIFSYIADGLENKLRDAIATHLRNCPKCMEKYRIIRTLFGTIKTKKEKMEKKFRRYRILCAYCDDELSNKARKKVEIAMKNSKELTKKVHAIRTMSEMISHSWHLKFDTYNLSLEKNIMERLKKECFTYKIKNMLGLIKI